MPIEVTGLSHIGIAVPDLAAAATVFRERFSCKVSEPIDVPAQKVRIVYVDLGNARLELIAPLGVDSPLAKFLEKRPEGGLHHVALAVADADDAAAAAKADGLRILGSGAPAAGHHGRPLFFLDPRALLGTLTEIGQAPRAGDPPPSH
ncbi:MAG: methylmalonyl-CoA epimerase [Rhizobiales bacterium]|nr:methylmalonyl-CoA epimerase [Hyphomicrobiales bacterium]